MATSSSTRGRAAELQGRGSERGVLDRLIEAVRAGESRALVVRGEPGVGKTALLEYVVEQAAGCRVERAAGIQSEMELPFAGVHQLVGPMLDRLERLPPPQRDALRTAFGVSTGSAPDRLFVALAVLSLLSDVAEEQPLICVVDDAHWLDRASAQALAFVARRLEAESVGLVFAARGASAELAGLPQLAVEGLGERDALALLDSTLTGAAGRARPRADRQRDVRQPARAAGAGPGVHARGAGRRVRPSRRRAALEEHRGELPAEARRAPGRTRRLLRLAAADPVGDPLLVWRAAERLGVATEAATPAAEAGLLELGTRVWFRHPLVRSAAYRSATVQERQEVHGALAEATDPGVDPDRRAWHRAQAAPGHDESVASELERSAGRAQARGGLAAAAAFLERAATLTAAPGRRAQRLLAAAEAKRDAGALDEALGLLVAVEARPLDALRSAEVEHLRGQIALEQQRGDDAASLLVSAARRFEPLDAGLARETHLEALVAAMWAGDPNSPGGVLDAAQAARDAPPGHEPPRAVDVLLDALAIRATEGYAAAAPTMIRALELVLAPEAGADEVLRLAGSRPSIAVAAELWDDESWHFLATRQAQLARATGALVQLRLALNFVAGSHILAGELTTATLMLEEDHLIAEATGNSPIAYSDMLLAAWRGREAQASELIEAALSQATARGLGRFVTFATYASAVLSNGLGDHAAARDAAARAFEGDQVARDALLMPELAEAASKTGDVALLRTALEWLSERTRVTPTDWVLGIEARVRALLSEGDVADGFHRESIARLGRTRVRVELARGHLLYGEWLRRERRRVDAREQLRTAHDLLDAMGIEAFAARARRELSATGETVRKRTVETRDELTAQEALIARLARDGFSNPEIGTRLFISPRTVKYHLRKVFTKLDISSRNQLDRVLPP